MKVSLFLMTLFVVAAVASANRKQRKLNRGGCRPSIQWTKCTEGKMIKTFVVPDTGNVTCNKPPAPEDVDCVSVKIIKDSKKPCAIEIRHDYTPCGEGQTEYTITKSFTKVSTDTECSQNKTFKAYCTGGKVGKGAAAKAEKKALKKKYKADLKAFKLQKREELAKGCEYQKTAECVDTKMKLPKVSGGEECADDLYRPCFGMKRAGRKNKKKLNRKMKRKNRGKK